MKIFFFFFFLVRYRLVGELNSHKNSRFPIRKYFESFSNSLSSESEAKNYMVYGLQFFFPKRFSKNSSVSPRKTKSKKLRANILAIFPKIPKIKNSLEFSFSTKPMKNHAIIVIWKKKGEE